MTVVCFVFFFQAEDGIRDHCVTGVQTCALPISDKMDEYPQDWVYIGGYLNGKLIAVSMVHLFEKGYKFHYQVLKSYRVYARIMLNQALGVIMPRCKKIYCEIPDLYQSVINFAKKAGFREVSKNESSILKNGQLYDRHLMVLETWAE